MEFFANEMSIHRQFFDLPTFQGAVESLMQMRGVVRHLGGRLYCHRSLVGKEPIPGMRMHQAVQALAVNQRRALLSWLTRDGPFWDDLPRHGGDDWLECCGDVVTDTGVGEAAYRTLHGVDCAVISAVPSDWDYSPIVVTWRREAEGLEDQNATLDNWRDAATLKGRLQDAWPPIRTWDDLCIVAETRFGSLTFSEHCFTSLGPVPFATSAARRIVTLLDVLNRLATAFDAGGVLTPQGRKIYQDYFTGENALFSDSSDTEKRAFRTELTFPHPDNPGESMFCAWHGKVRRLTLRLHFSWPICADGPVYIVYVGPKLTKR